MKRVTHITRPMTVNVTRLHLEEGRPGKKCMKGC